MRRLIALTAAAFVAVASQAALAQGAGKKSMAPEGSFHQLHSKKLEMTCATCHKKEATDVLWVRKDELPAPGAVDRNGCLACHKDPRKPTWYK